MNSYKMEMWRKAQRLERKWWSQESTLKIHTPADKPSHDGARVSKGFWSPYLDVLGRNNIFTEQLQRALDIGCGPTGILKAINTTMKCGVDTLIDTYDQLYKLDPSTNYLLNMGEALCFQNESMDIIFCINALDHCAYPLKVLAEIRRVLKPKGYFMLVVSTYTHFRFFLELTERIFRARLLGKAVLHPHAFTKKKMSTILNKTGFSIIETCNSDLIQGQRIYLSRCC